MNNCKMCGKPVFIEGDVFCSDPCRDDYESRYPGRRLAGALGSCLGSMMGLGCVVVLIVGMILVCASLL